MATDDNWIEELQRWRDDGTLGRLYDLAELSREYHPGLPPADGVRTVRVRRSSGRFSQAVLTGLGHAGRSSYVKLRHEYGGKLVDTAKLLEWNPWLETSE